MLTKIHGKNDGDSFKINEVLSAVRSSNETTYHPVTRPTMKNLIGTYVWMQT
jgi:hypothetical protein